MTTVIMRDDKPIALVEDSNAAVAWLHNHQGQSVDHATKHEGYSFGEVVPWSDEEKARYSNTARNVAFNDSFHNRRGCINEGKMGRDNCSVCALNGWGSESDADGPNYAGWARIYVEARIPIPRKWEAAFEAERKSDNVGYAHALERSILTFGFSWAK